MDDFFQVTLQNFLESTWLKMTPLYLGDVPPGLGTPDLYVTVEKSNEPFMLLNIYSTYGPPIPPQNILWQEWLFVGFGKDLHIVSLATRQSFSHKFSLEVEWYCTGFYPLEDFLLVSTAGDVLCFDKKAHLKWISEAVGIDGVIIEAVVGNVVKGTGEWDPPGGWRPFELDLATGKVI